MGNPFDKIATTKTPATKKAKKITASVTDDIKKAVDAVIKFKASIKMSTSALGNAELLVIEHVKPQQKAEALKGNYSKSFLVEGTDEEHSLTYTTMDKFSIANDEEVHDAIKKLLGKDFKKYIETKRIITLKPKAVKNKKLMAEIFEAIKKAEIDVGDVFAVTDSFITVKGLDEDQYKIPKKIQEEFNTLIRQNKPSLK